MTEISDSIQRGSNRQEKCGEEACHGEATKARRIRQRRGLYFIDTGWTMRVLSDNSSSYFHIPHFLSALLSMLSAVKEI